MVQKSATKKQSEKAKKDTPMASYEDRLKAVLSRKSQLEENRVSVAKQRMLQSTLKHEKLVAQKRKEFERKNQNNNSRIASVLQRKQQILLQDHARKVEILRKVELRCIKAAETRSKMVGKVSKRKTSLSQAIFHQLDLPKSKFNMSRKTKVNASIPKRLVNTSKTVAPKSPVPMSPKRTRSASGTRVSNTGPTASSYLNDPSRSKTLTREKKTVPKVAPKDLKELRKSEPMLTQQKKTSTPNSKALTAKPSTEGKPEPAKATPKPAAPEEDKDKSSKKEKEANSEIEFYKQKMAEHRRAMREKMNAANKTPQSAKVKVSPTTPAAPGSKLEATLEAKPDTKDLDNSLSQILSLTNAASENKVELIATDGSEVKTDDQAKESKIEGKPEAEPEKKIPSNDATSSKDSGVSFEKPAENVTPEKNSSANASGNQTPGVSEDQKLKFFEKEEKLIMDQERIRAEAEKERLREQEEFERMQEERRKAEEQERAERRARLEAIMKRTRTSTTPSVPVSSTPKPTEESKPNVSDTPQATREEPKVEKPFVDAAISNVSAASEKFEPRPVDTEKSNPAEIKNSDEGTKSEDIHSKDKPAESQEVERTEPARVTLGVRENTEADRGTGVESSDSTREYSREHSVSPEPVVDSGSLVASPSEEGVKSASLVRGDVDLQKSEKSETDNIAVKDSANIDDVTKTQTDVLLDLEPQAQNVLPKSEQPQKDTHAGFSGLEDSGISLDTTLASDFGADLLSLESASANADHQPKAENGLPKVDQNAANIGADSKLTGDLFGVGALDNVSNGVMNGHYTGESETLLDFSEDTSKNDDSIPQATAMHDKVCCSITVILLSNYQQEEILDISLLSLNSSHKLFS